MVDKKDILPRLFRFIVAIIVFFYIKNPYIILVVFIFLLVNNLLHYDYYKNDLKRYYSKEIITTILVFVYAILFKENLLAIIFSLFVLTIVNRNTVSYYYKMDKIKSENFKKDSLELLKLKYNKYLKKIDSEDSFQNTMIAVLIAIYIAFMTFIVSGPINLYYLKSMESNFSDINYSQVQQTISRIPIPFDLLNNVGLFYNIIFSIIIIGIFVYFKKLETKSYVELSEKIEKEINKREKKINKIDKENDKSQKKKKN